MNADMPFSTSNACEWMVSDTVEYEFILNLDLSNIGGFPGTPIPLELSSQSRLSQNIIIASTENAITASWEDDEGATAYRFHIDYNGDDIISDGDYLLCVQASQSNYYTQEIPNIAEKVVLHESLSATYPEANNSYTIILDISKENTSPGKQFCENDGLFPGDPIIYEDIAFGTAFSVPAIPEFTITSADISGRNFPHIRITSPCNTDSSASFTFFWMEVGKPQAEESLAFTGCEGTLPISTVGERQISYLIWAIATNDVGTSERSQTITWVNTGESERPAPPRNVMFHWQSFNSLIISWEPSELTSNALVDEYQLEYNPENCPDDPLDAEESLMFPNGENQAEITPMIQESYCIRVLAISNGISSSAIEIITSPPPLGQTVVGARDVSVSWQASNPSEVSHYNAIVSSNSDCAEEQIIFFKTIVPNPLETDTIFTETFPLLSGNPGYYVCINAIYRNGNLERVFTSLEIGDEPEPLIPKVAPGPIILQQISGEDNLELIVNLEFQEDARYFLGRLSYDFCIEILLPSEGGTWTGVQEISGAVENYETDIENLMLAVNSDEMTGTLTYSPLEFSNGVDSPAPIQTMPGETYRVRVWLSLSENPRCDMSEGVHEASFTTPMP